MIDESRTFFVIIMNRQKFKCSSIGDDVADAQTLADLKRFGLLDAGNEIEVDNDFKGDYLLVDIASQTHFCYAI